MLYKKGNNGSEQEQKKEQDDKKIIARKITGIRCERSDNNIGVKEQESFCHHAPLLALLSDSTAHLVC
jgi:hypothetical protein